MHGVRGNIRHGYKEGIHFINGVRMQRLWHWITGGECGQKRATSESEVSKGSVAPYWQGP